MVSGPQDVRVVVAEDAAASRQHVLVQFAGRLVAAHFPQSGAQAGRCRQRVLIVRAGLICPLPVQRCGQIMTAAGVTARHQVPGSVTGEAAQVSVAKMEGWLTLAEDSDLPELRSFANGVRDQQAVTAGLTLPYSPVWLPEEGFSVVDVRLIRARGQEDSGGCSSRQPDAAGPRRRAS